MKTPVCGFSEKTSFAQSEITVYVSIELAPRSESVAEMRPTWYPRGAFSGMSNEYACSENEGGLSLVSVTWKREKNYELEIDYPDKKSS